MSNQTFTSPCNQGEKKVVLLAVQNVSVLKIWQNGLQIKAFKHILG
jgi:hypothetical protein